MADTWGLAGSMGSVHRSNPLPSSSSASATWKNRLRIVSKILMRLAPAGRRPGPPRCAASWPQAKAAMSIFFIASSFWYAPGVCISSAMFTGTTCQLNPKRSTHQPHCSASGTALSTLQ